jgi:hypothetical protein
MSSYEHTSLASEDLFTDGSTSSDSLDSLDSPMRGQRTCGTWTARRVFGVVFAVSGVCLVFLGVYGSRDAEKLFKSAGTVHNSLHSEDLDVMISAAVRNSNAIARPTTPTEILEGPWDDAAQKYMSIHKLPRGERLVMGGVRHVYHQTSMEACKAILKTGFRTGINGIIGDGIYFAERSLETGRKTRHYGCMIEVLVRLGRVYNAGEGYGTNPPNRDRLLQMGFDSVTVVDPTQAHYGREFEIYHQD